MHNLYVHPSTCKIHDNVSGTHNFCGSYCSLMRQCLHGMEFLISIMCISGHENPHTIREARHQITFSINVCAGIIGEQLIGPAHLPEQLTGPMYREFLERLTQDILPDVLDDVPLQLRVGMWFMHDGAPPHFSRIACQYLNDHFPGKWIGRNGPVAWPPCSPDLNPIDFHLWGHVKNEVHTTPLTNVDKLWERIATTFDAIKN